MAEELSEGIINLANIAGRLLDTTVCYDELDDNHKFKRTLGKFVDIGTTGTQGGDLYYKFDGGETGETRKGIEKLS